MKRAGRAMQNAIIEEKGRRYLISVGKNSKKKGGASSFFSYLSTRIIVFDVINGINSCIKGPALVQPEKDS